MMKNLCLNFPEKANVKVKGECTWLAALLSCPKRVEALHEITSVFIRQLCISEQLVHAQLPKKPTSQENISMV